MTEAAPTAAVLIIGDEILSGRTADTNLNTIARFLSALGIDLMEARTVGDRPTQIIAALNALRSTHDYVFTTGGIGPTHDDITADCVAEAFGVALPEHPDALAILERRYGDDLNSARRRMARIPEGGSLIANPVTDAPGFQMGNVFVMAGVPKIMTAMLEDVAPRLKTGAIVHSETLKVTGVGEGHIADTLGAAARASRDLSFGSYPFGAGTTGEIGTNLVVRGRDGSAVEAATDALMAALTAAGIQASRV
ncbi:competence/damage-inducible protein A [Rhizobium sp. CRIBSB]|nr:competence/damage-inducible protein A [Rhizobium sp. CRIBSB]